MDFVDQNLRRLEAAGGRLVVLLDSPPIPAPAGDEALEVADEALAAYRILDGAYRRRAFGVLCNCLSVAAGLGRFADVEGRLDELSAASPLDVLTASVGWRGIFENACMVFTGSRDGAGLLGAVASARRLANRCPSAVARWVAVGVAARTAANRLATWARWDEHGTLVDWFEEVPAPLRGAVADDHAVLLADWAVLGMDRGDWRDAARAFDRFDALGELAAIPEVRRQHALGLACAVEVFVGKSLPAPSTTERLIRDLGRVGAAGAEDREVAWAFARTLPFVVEGLAGLEKLDEVGGHLVTVRRCLELHRGDVEIAFAAARTAVNGAILRRGRGRTTLPPDDPVAGELRSTLRAAIACCPGQDELVEAAHRWHRVTGRSIAE